MEKDLEKTVVVFRRFKDRGDIVALFPNLINYPDGGCESYQHVGQHGSADYNHCMKCSVAATNEESAALKLELEGLGYNLDVKKRHRVVKVKTAVEHNLPEVNSETA